MDRFKQQKPKRTKVTVTVVCVGVLVAISAGFASTNLDFSHKRLDRGLLALGTVQAGPMDVKVNATGILLPRKVEWLSAEVDGQVENQVLDQEAIVLAAKFAHEREILQEEAEAQLIETKTIPEIQYRKTKLNVAQLGQIGEIERQRLQRQIDNKTSLLAVKDAKVQQAKSALMRATSRVDALSVTAGIAGVVQELPLEIGQRLQPGTKLGQIANHDTLYAELRVAARQASEIAVGQPVSIDTRNGIVDGEVSRVDPAVSDGLVTVEVNIDGELPKGAKAGFRWKAPFFFADRAYLVCREADLR